MTLGSQTYYRVKGRAEGQRYRLSFKEGDVRFMVMTSDPVQVLGQDGWEGALD
jgi:hypothetical protein